MMFNHFSVLLDESIEMLDINPEGVYVDGTLGGGGHSSLICQRLSEKGTLIGIDRDTTAIEAATERLSSYNNKKIIVHDNFMNIKNILKELGVDKIDGAILDLGVSSPQLDTAERGFSYNMDAPLDMRMDRDSDFSAYDVVNGYSEDELKRIIFAYGEEKFAPQIAREIVKHRAEKPIETTFELSEIIKNSMPVKARFADKHPAKRTFQAIRIEVNRELEPLEDAIRDFVEVLKPQGVLGIITFHSLEDRIVKNTFLDLTKGCICPKEFPVCVCGHKPTGELVNRKPVVATDTELKENNRSHSAKLRGFRKL